MNNLLYLVDVIAIGGSVAYGIWCEGRTRRLKRENEDLARRLREYRLTRDTSVIQFWTRSENGFAIV